MIRILIGFEEIGYLARVQYIVDVLQEGFMDYLTIAHQEHH